MVRTIQSYCDMWKTNLLRYAAAILLLFAGMLAAMGQSVLSKKVDLTVQNAPLEQVLELIEEKGGFVFSYPTDIIEGDRLVSINAKNESLRSILITTLGDDKRYLERGSYVIIQQKKRPKTPKQGFEISGQLVDANTGERISSATIYEVNRLKSTVSSEDGEYRLKVKEKADYLQLAIAKENYKDTILELRKEQLKDLVIELEPLNGEEPVYEKKDQATDTLALVKLLVNEKAASHMENVHLYEKKAVQFSFLPMLGTNKLMSGKTTNSLSFNLLAGYAYALDGFELGGLANINRQNVNGLQVAGFTNIVGGRTRGGQVAGFANVTKYNMKGIQVAGFSNTVANRFSGLQVAGFLNVSPEVKGIQVSGFLNTAWSASHTHQFSGFANITRVNSGTQWAGFANVGLKETNGTQVGGFMNYAKSVKGIQIAGFANFALKEVNGIQIGSFLNYTKRLKGIQIGLINICDTVESGLNIGFLSFVRHGIQDLELHYSPTMHANLLFKTGTNRFYNILAAGYRLDKPLWSVGYGVGARHHFKKGMLTGIELMSSTVRSETQSWTTYTINQLTQLHAILGYKWGKGIALTSGPVLNVYYSRFY
ncbi:MAG: hypothetical protein JJ975_04205, partial [Bacteroidia bacterium]|nr:hypothetical protein [Bacteroidia bacterium]